MERSLSPLGFVFAALVFTLTLLGASLVIPTNDYYRWQEHTSGTTRKADWIYERLHFDAEPIDIALIGTSRMAGGVSGPDIEAAYCKATGRRIRVANLAIPETGRNMHYVIAKEAVRTKAPSLIIVELNEIESRRPHNGFIALADTQDVLSAPAFINVNYLSDLARLPGRQAILLMQSLAKRGAVRASFEKSAYLGHDLDRTRELPLLDGRVISRFKKTSEEELDAERQAALRESSAMKLPAALHALEYRFSRLYLKKIEQLAEKGGGEVDYVFMPAWRAPTLPTSVVANLSIDKPIIDLGGRVAEDPDKWLDATHLNAWGAIEQTERFAAEIIRRRPSLGVQGCVQPSAEPAPAPQR